MLSLGLTSLLLVAVYSALQMHWTYSTLGQAEMERSQVARALFRRIETDLRSVIFRAAPLSSSSTDSGSSGSSNSGTNSSSGSLTSDSSGSSGSSSSSSISSDSTSTDPTQQSSTQKTGLFGDSQSLIVHASLPSRASSGLGPSPSSAAAAAMTSDQQSVAYFLVGSSSTLAQQLSPNLTSSGAVSYGQTGTGLARMQGDRMAMEAADESGDYSVLSARVQVLAPEVASMQFEFFDGVSWTDTWDSGTSSSVPNAVRITIEFSPPNTPRGGWFARSVNPSTNRYQHVVALPLAEPYVDSTSF